jgi:hypothetical protein
MQRSYRKNWIEREIDKLPARKSIVVVKVLYSFDMIQPSPNSSTVVQDRTPKEPLLEGR